MHAPRTVLSWGMGADSTAILWRWLHEPDSRWFELDDLVVLTAQVGDEFDDTRALCEHHILPELARHRVRLVQVARAGPSETDGMVVLDDSRQPTKLHTGGSGWSLGDELRAAGTVAQVANGRRICSTKFKGFPLDTWCDANAAVDYTHVLGFNADEVRRATRDEGYCRPGRSTRYPLIDWGWGRIELEAYLLAETDVAWPRSCCTFCPFAGSAKSLPGHLERWSRHPDQAVEALVLEHVALALNPRMGLFGTKRAVDQARSAGLESLLDVFADRLGAAEHAVYEVRRLTRASTADPSKKGPTMRSVRCLDVGSAAAMAASLASRAADHGIDVETGDDRIDRVWLARRGATFPAREHFLVAAPCGVRDKERTGFAAAWDRAEAITLFDEVSVGSDR
jgi:hypothetical protein